MLFSQLHRLVNEREKVAEVKRAEIRRLEDSFIRSKKELEQKLKDAVPVTGKQKDSETLGLLVQFLALTNLIPI